MRKKQFGKRLLLSLGALSLALGSAGLSPDAALPVQAAVEIPEGTTPTGTWGTAPYYLLDDGTLYFGAGVASGSKKLYLGNYVRRIESDPGFDTSQITSLSEMFNNYSKLEDISGLATWDVSNVTNMYGLFGGTKITNVDALASWNTGKLTSLNSAFYNCEQLSDISGLEDWNTANLTDMNGAFQNCTSLRSLHGMENWDVSALESMSCTFQDAGLESIAALSEWQTSSLSNVMQLFNGTKISDVSPLGGWDVSQFSGLGGMLANLPNLTSLDGLENWNLENCWSFGGFAEGSNALRDISAMASWQVHPTQWKDLSDMLNNPAIEVVDLSGWDLSNANVNNAAPNIYGFRPSAIRLSAKYLSTKDTNKTALIDGNGADSGYGSSYMSADLAHGPMSSSDIISGWQDDWSGWWGLAVDVTLSDGGTQTQTVKMPMLCEVSVPMDAFTREGHVLTGWQDAQGNTYDADHPYTVAKASQQTLSAVWQLTRQARTQITLDANGGSGSMDTVQISEGESYTVPQSAFERDRHEFTGWNTKADGTGAAYEPGALITAGDTDADITLFAQWRYVPAKTTLHFDANGGKGAMEDLVIEEDTLFTLPGAAFVRDGYDFAGWNTKADGTGTAYEDQAQLRAGTDDTQFTLYAQWTRTIDLRHLQAAHDKAGQLVLDDFAPAGHAGLNESLDQAKNVLKDPASQQAVNEAASRLHAALLELRRLPDARALHDLDEWSEDIL